MLRYLLFILLFINSLFAQKTVFTALKEDKNKISIYLINKNIYDITAKIDLKLNINNKSIKKKVIKSFKPNSKTLIFTTKHPHKAFKYTSKYTWVLGSKDAIHNNKYLYRLPYALNSIEKVSQGFNGKTTHKKQSQYAVDFSLKLGTKIYASRGGIVVQVKDDSSKHGFSKSFAKFSNFITIKHNDNTYATYAHLKKNGAKVKVGQIVSRGDFIGYSGNSGYSNGPHLHFIVFKAKDYKSRVSIPIKFISEQRVIIAPITGQAYKATL
jgi:murein DD-endopeptidase MepM/ murein hydrolase activator NlpD